MTAIVNEANSPIRGSTPAMIENEIASGIRASATTRPERTSIRSTRAGGGRHERRRGDSEAGSDIGSFRERERA